jgi:5-methyltetrahydrofolate--homocysteine methyltransferase
VHDIGKNIVGIVLQCNNYEIIDLGVMVPAEKILETAQKEKADIIGLSGLITPSLEEMVHVAEEMENKGFTQPLLIGGATTSVMHTAVKIQPRYRHGVVHVKDASRSVSVVGNLLSKEKDRFLEKTETYYGQLRKMNREKPGEYIPLEEARERRFRPDWDHYAPPLPARPGRTVFEDIPLEEVIPFIDWTFFFHVWELKGKFPGILDHPGRGEEARKIYEEGKKCLDRLTEEKILKVRGVVSLLPAAAAGDDILVYEDEERKKVRGVLYHLRQQEARTATGYNLCLSDYIAPAGTGVPDHIGLFAVTGGIGLEHYLEQFGREHDDFRALMVKALADRLAEAATEWLHAKVRKELWGFAPEEQLSRDDLFRMRYRGIRPAYGYPACPDHSEKENLFALLEAERHTGIRLTEGFAMMPAASVSGLIFSHPDAVYFDIRRILEDQVADYALRKKIPLAQAEKYLSHLIYRENE